MNKAILVFMLTIYLVANVASLSIPFIPPIEMLFLWGIIFPLLAIGIAWYSAHKHKPNQAKWYIRPSVLSLFFIICSTWSIYYLIGVYGSV